MRFYGGLGGEPMSLTVEGKKMPEVPLRRMKIFCKSFGSSWHLFGTGVFTGVYFKLSHSHNHLSYSTSRQKQVKRKYRRPNILT